MATITVDSLKYADILEAAGVPPEQAEALLSGMGTGAFDTFKYTDTLNVTGEIPPEQAEALSGVMEATMETLAAKGDLVLMKKDIDARFNEMDARLVQLEQRMTLKLGVMLTVAVGMTVALAKLL